jgi:hypothetical protein
MRKALRLTLRILKSLYPWADLGAAGEGFTVTCSNDEANKLVEDSTMMVTRVIETPDRYVIDLG